MRRGDGGWGWALALIVAAALGCAPRLTREDVEWLDGRTAVLVIVEPSAVPSFEPDQEVRPSDVLREARALAGEVRGASAPRSGPRRLSPPAQHELASASDVLAHHLSGRYSKLRSLRPPPRECVLHGAAPDVPQPCAQLPVALRVQVREIRFTSGVNELRLDRFSARSSLVDRATHRTLWESRCELLPVELPMVPGARGAFELNQVLEQAAQLCADRLELDLREAAQRAR